MSRIERERGSTAHDVRTLRMLAGALSIPAHLLGISEPRDPKEVDPVHRREFLGLAPAVALGAHDRPAPGRVGRADISEVQQAVDDLRALDQRIGGDRLQRLAGMQVRRVRDLLARGSYGPDTGRALSTLLGEASVLAGWLAFDSCRHDASARLYAAGLAAAETAGDGLLAAHACANLSMLATELHQPLRAVQYARAGQLAAARRGGPRLRSLLLVREAHGHAGLHDAAATHDAVGRAERAYADSCGEDPAWTDFLSEAELAGVVGIAMQLLGDVDRGIRHFRIATEMEGRARNRAAWTLQLAAAHVAAGDAAQGCAVAESALPLVRDLASTRVRQQLGGIFVSTAAHDACPGVRDFRERLATLRLSS